jgi:PGF-CTERM protein
MEYRIKEVMRSILIVSAIGIALCLLPVSVHAGVSPDVGRAIGDNDFAIIGETNLSFVGSDGVLIPNGTLKGDWDFSIPIPFPNAGDVFDSSKEDDLVSGSYIVIGGNGATTTSVSFLEPKLNVTPRVNNEDFNWVTRGGEIILYADTNLNEILGSKPNNISYKLSDPQGRRVYEVNTIINPTRLSDISVDGSGDYYLTINTTGMRTGTYTLSIETDPDTNNGLDEEGPGKSFEVRSKGVRIVEPEQEERTVTVTEVKTLKIETTPHTSIAFEVTWGLPSKVYFEDPKTQKKVGGGISDPKGILELNAYFDVTGAFEITATEEVMGTSDSIFVESVPYEAEITEPSEEVYYIGVPVTIKGKVTAGDSVTIKIEAENIGTVERDGDSFEAPDKWQTEDKSPDSYKIAIWVSPFSDPATDPPDDSKTIMLLRGGLFAEPSASFVALGDKFTIGGIVPGRDRVDILTIAPDGGGGRGLDPDDISDDTGDKVPGLTYETTGVDTDGEFETEEITVGKDVDTGTYLIAALNYGRDGVWGKSLNGDLLNVTSNNNIAILAAKTTDQLLAMLKDKTINAAGTDDLLGIATISVQKGFVTLDELEDVPLGKKIEITGTTNRQVDTSIIVTVEGLEETTPKLKPQIATVKEDDKTFYNTFSISFDTKSTNIGTYEVTADDGDGHTASTTVTILPAEEHSVTVSTTPTPKIEDQEPETGEEVEKPPAKTTTPAPTEEVPEETEEQPGFGMSLAIAGLLLAVVVLLRRRNRNKGDGRVDLVTLTK